MPTATRQRRVVRQKAKGPVDPELGRRVRALRVARSMTQAELAAEDFTKGFISLVENARTRISLRAAEILARRLGVAVTDLFGTVTPSDRDLEFVLLRAEQTLASGDPAGALRMAESAEPKSESVLKARFQRVRARALIESTRSKDAVRLLDQALRTFRRHGLADLEARTLFDLARAHDRLDSPGEALNLALACERAIETGRVADRTLELDVHQFLASAYARLGDHSSADLRAERALALAKDIADPAAVARLYSDLALARHEQGELDAALTYARRSLELYEQLRKEAAVAEAWNSLGRLYVRRGHYAKAAEALAEAERRAGDARNERLASCILATRAELALARGELAHAVAIAEKSATHPGAAPECRADALLVKAQALARHRASLAKVRSAFEEAIAAHDGEPQRRRAKAHEAYAQVLAARGEAKSAYEHARQALQLLRPALG